MRDYTTTAYGAALAGLTAKIIVIEARKDDGHGVTMEGVREPSLDGWTRETLIRVRAALAVLGVGGVAFRIDPKPTPDARLDVAIVAACLGALGMLSGNILGSTLFLGELGLEGQVRPVRGLLPLLVSRRGDGEWPKHQRVIVPNSNADEVAAAGGHGLYLVGHERRHALVSALRSLLPPMTLEKSIVTTSLHSIVGFVGRGEGLLSARPMRAPHCTVSDVGLVGGGHPPRPGEASLAHLGILFLDEAPEFRQTTLKRLAYALSKGKSIMVSKQVEHVSFPARPLLVLGSKIPTPPPRGRTGFETRAEYVARPLIHLSPFVDLRVHPREGNDEGSAPSLDSLQIRARVVAASAFGDENEKKVIHHSQWSPVSTSAARIARTIANLAGSSDVLPEHREEARTFAISPS